jgi:LmbE family N-acetylglucosaminyl deacetylase
MRITDLEQIQHNYDHIYLSPHLDDAALSCGGAIVGQRRAGERVLVVTLCTLAPAPEGPFSELAQEFHGQWALTPDQVVAARLREDALSMERLGADYLWANMLDAIYRFPQAYNARATLFATPAPEDPLLPALREFIGELRRRAPGATIYAPLGVGSHVDHLLTYAAARDGMNNVDSFYEDFPYVAKPGALEMRMAGIGAPLHARVIDIDGTLAEKISAVEAYASQLTELFGGAEAMARAVAGYAKGLGEGHAERLWIVD